MPDVAHVGTIRSLWRIRSREMAEKMPLPNAPLGGKIGLSYLSAARNLKIMKTDRKSKSSQVSAGDEAGGREGEGMKLVRRKVDLVRLPPLTPAQEAELAALASRSADAIDYSDIPEATDAFFENAVQGRFGKVR